MVLMGPKGSRLKVGWTLGKLVTRRLFDARVGEKDIELGDVLTGQLDEMKGLAMKLGQIVSYMDVPLPEEVQARLARLQVGISGLSEEETQGALGAALGADFIARFESFELKPFAAASIGQVHRARYQGREVVVKLQYPQVARGFQEDLHSMNRIASLASLASAVDGQAIVRELGERLDEECDYEREARAQTAFRHLFTNDPNIVVPDVVAELSTPTTLGTVFCDGVSYSEARNFSGPIRTELAHALVRFSYTGLFQACAIQADPHPGNFKFNPDGRLVCLDFGCVRTFEPEFIEKLRALLSAIDQKDKARFRQAVIELGMAPRPKKFDFEHYFAMMEHLHRPLLSPSFQFTSAFVKQGLAYNGPKNPNARTMNMPPPYIWVVRLQWGLWSLLTRLDARVELRPFVEELVSSGIEPLALFNGQKSKRGRES